MQWATTSRKGVLAVVFAGLVVAGAHLGEGHCQATSGCQEEVPTSAGRVDHLDLEQRPFLLGLAMGFAEPFVDHRDQGALDQLLHQGIGCVVATGGFAVATGTASIAELPLVALLLQLGMQVEQSLIDTAQLFSVEVAVAHAGEAAVQRRTSQSP